MKEYYKQTITMTQCLHEIEATNKNLKEIYANQSAMFYKVCVSSVSPLFTVD